MSRAAIASLLAGVALWLGVMGCVTAAEPEVVPTFSIRNQTMPFPGILAAGQPTEEQLKQAAAEGFRTVINLRAPGENGELPGEEKLVHSTGMNYLAIPIGGHDGINFENAGILARALEEPGATPAIVHCASSNRVGALLALKAFRFDDTPAEEAIAIGKAAGLKSLEPVVRELMTSAP